MPPPNQFTLNLEINYNDARILLNELMNFGVKYSCYLEFSNVTSIWNDAVADIRQKRVSMKLSKVNYIS